MDDDCTVAAGDDGAMPSLIQHGDTRGKHDSGEDDKIDAGDADHDHDKNLSQQRP